LKSTKNYACASFGSLIVLLAPVMIFSILQPGRVFESIAVLPLENLSGDPEQDYFSDGLHDALITDLGQVGGFKRVIARGSVMRFKGTRTPLAQVAQALKVDALITGAVLRSGDRVRVTARLVDPKSEVPLWVQSHERDLRDILALHHEIVSAIARTVKVKLTRQEAMRLSGAHRVNPEAYDAYLKGQSQWYQLNRQGLDGALKYYTLALEKDPGFAPTYVGVAGVWSLRKWQTLVRPSEATPKEKAAALKALELDGTLAEAHFRLAGIKTWADWDWPGAEKAFRRTIELNPNHLGARIDYSHFLSIMKRPKEAMQQAACAMELDPLNPSLKAFYAMDLMYVHRYDDAIALLRDTLKTSPNDGQVLSTLRSAYHMKQMYGEALEIWKASYAARGDHEAEDALALGFEEGGYQGALQHVAEMLIARSRTTYVTPWQIGTLYTRAGKINEALEWLEKAREARDPNMPYISADPIFDILRVEPRFQDLLRQMKLPE
jgi:TolB-like protein/Tfp pilus assembly protein PilF